MGEETTRRISDFRDNLSALSNDYSQYENPESEADDPISAYFKQRCGNYSKTYFKKHIESDSDSSIGCIDVDNVSLFGDGEPYEDTNLRLSENLLEQLRSDSISTKANRKDSDVSKTLTPDSEGEIEKQRLLAQKALSKLNGRTNEKESQLTPEVSRDSKALSDISSKLINTKFSLGKEVDKIWFQPNCSPNTPRCFNDELSSFGGEEESLPHNKSRQSQYAKSVSSMLKELSQLNFNSDVKFESRSKEEQINRFEEDERKFKLENSGVLHNSGISQFSGIIGGDISQCLSETAKHQKLEAENEKLSIGQFFNLRSNRVSSLLGSESDVSENSVSVMEQKSGSTTLTEKEMQKILRNDYSLPVNDTAHLGTLKPRRCVSTYDLKRTPNMTKTTRYSTDSASSNSTILIQNILAEMESGLSGTQIYEKLMRSYGKKSVLEKANQNKAVVIIENNETPKSSKVQQRRCNKEMGPEKEVQVIRERKSPLSDIEAKENRPLRNCKSIENISSGWNDKARKVKGRKGFDASTPKLQGLRSQSEKFKSACNKVLMNAEDWEVPRVSSIQPTIDLNKSGLSEEHDKTLMVNTTMTSAELNKKNNTVAVNDTFTIEDTIVAGDLTVLSQRIDEMKGDGFCIVRSADSEEPELLTVVQKLASLPKGSIDCSALTPLLRDQFPELLSTFPTPSKEFSLYHPTPTSEKPQDVLLSKPGSWVKLPSVIGLREKIYVCTEVRKSISVPVINVSKNWLLVSIQAVALVHSNGQKLQGVHKNDEWTIFDFLNVFMKETIIPPESQQSLKMLFTPKVPTKMDLKLTFRLKGLINQEIQTRSIRIQTNNVNPLNNLNVIPKDSINFGIIADQCSDHRTVQVSFDGICELPLMVYIEENESQYQHFILKPYTANNGNSQEGDWNDGKFHHVLREGEKQLLEFRIIFQPHTLLDDGNKSQDYKALLILRIGSETDSDGILHKIPIKGSVGFAKFLCNPECTPLVFRASEKGQSITRAFPLKNVGYLPIAFTIKVVSEESKTEVDDNLFAAPKSFYLSRNEESAINITFNANVTENCTKRILILQMKPNGRAIYDVELIGIVISSDGRPVSRTSGVSASTKSIASTESVPIKLMTTAHSISWPAVPLEKEVRQTFQIKNSSCVPASARISFKKNLDSFKLVNENGEKVQKIRKVLKPDCPYTLTVAFRPDLVGAHHNAVFIETSQTAGRKQVGLCGIGGMPSLFIGNVKSDLNGCRLLRLQSSSQNNQLFVNFLQFKNEGRIPGFILIKSNTEALSLSHELTITPSSCVIAPDSNVIIKLSQKLKSGDLQGLLAGKDISKIATLSVVMGDEPSRLRMRKLIKSGKVEASERLKLFTDTFCGEKEMSLKGFDDSPVLESLFLKSLKVIEVAVVVERISGVCEPTMLEDDEDTVDEFVTICSANENTIISISQKASAKPSRSEEQMSKSSDCDMTLLSSDSLSSHNKITKWLESIDCPSN